MRKVRASISAPFFPEAAQRNVAREPLAFLTCSEVKGAGRRFVEAAAPRLAAAAVVAPRRAVPDLACDLRDPVAFGMVCLPGDLKKRDGGAEGRNVDRGAETRLPFVTLTPLLSHPSPLARLRLTNTAYIHEPHTRLTHTYSVSHMEFNGLRLEPLHGAENWPEWSCRIKGFMVLSGHLWGYVDGTKVCPTADTLVWGVDPTTGEEVKRKVTPKELEELTERWKQGDSQASAIMSLGIDYRVWVNVEYECKRNVAARPEYDLPPATEVWAALKRIFDSNTMLNHMRLRRELDAMRQRHDETPVQLAWRMLAHSRRMKACGVQVDDAQFAYKLIDLLPNNTSGDIARQTLLGSNSLTTSDVVEMLERNQQYDEIQAMRSRAEAAAPAAVEGRPAGGRRQRALAANHNAAPNSTTCEHCSSTQHTGADCYEHSGYPEWWAGTRQRRRARELASRDGQRQASGS